MLLKVARLLSSTLGMWAIGCDRFPKSDWTDTALFHEIHLNLMLDLIVCLRYVRKNVNISDLSKTLRNIPISKANHEKTTH
jgi:hypothetical protein